MKDTHKRTATDIGMMVHQARVQHGMSQGVLAKKCRMYQSSLARIENGRTMPTISTLLKIAKGLDTELILPSFAGMKDIISYRKRKISNE